MMRRYSKILMIIVLVGWLMFGCTQKKVLDGRLAGPLPIPENHWVKTDDGWSLHILHYAPVRVDPNRAPVILCHGLSHNNTFWDLTESTSLAKYLQGSGFDVWSVSLRGSGQSTKPTLSEIRRLFRLNISSLNPQGVISRQPGLLRLNWTVDDHINHDIPAILSYVTGRTKSPQVIWVGHSLGAMIMYAYLTTHPQTQIRAFVSVAGPMYLVHPGNDVFEMMARDADFVRISNSAMGINFRAVVGTLAGDMLQIQVDRLFLNEQNVDPVTLRAFYYANQDDISPGQLDQLLQYIKRGNFVSYDGKTNYTAALGKINVPVLQILGQLDNMVDPGFAAEVHQQLGSSNKKLRVFGRINGYRADYGHDDIVIGRHARDEVFPYITNWLTAEAVSSRKILP